MIGIFLLIHTLLLAIIYHESRSCSSLNDNIKQFNMSSRSWNISTDLFIRLDNKSHGTRVNVGSTAMLPLTQLWTAQKSLVTPLHAYKLITSWARLHPDVSVVVLQAFEATDNAVVDSRPNMAPRQIGHSGKCYFCGVHIVGGILTYHHIAHNLGTWE